MPNDSGPIEQRSNTFQTFGRGGINRPLVLINSEAESELGPDLPGPACGATKAGKTGHFIAGRFLLSRPTPI